MQYRLLNWILIYLSLCELGIVIVYISYLVSVGSPCASEVVLAGEVASSPAQHVSRDAEDHLGWAKGSAVERQIQEFHQQADDFLLLQAA